MRKYDVISALSEETSKRVTRDIPGMGSTGRLS